MAENPNSNHPYLSVEAMSYLKDHLGLKIFMTNLPSFDKQGGSTEI